MLSRCILIDIYIYTHINDLNGTLSLFIQASWINPSYQAPDDWPDKGEIEFQQLGIRYREDLDLALKEIDCQIYPNEKVLIVINGKRIFNLYIYKIHSDLIQIPKKRLERLDRDFNV